MAVSVPVIGTAIGGAAEILEHGSSALVIEPGDHIGMADSIKRLIDVGFESDWPYTLKKMLRCALTELARWTT